MKIKIFLIRIIDKMSYVLIKLITLRNSQQSIKIGNKTFVLDLNKPTFHSEKFHYFVIDYDNGAQLQFNSTESAIKPEQIDLMLSNKIIKELTSGIVENKFEKILPFILGIVIGGLSVAVIAMIIYQKSMKELYDSLVKSEEKDEIPILSIIEMIKLLWKVLRKKI